jgi:4-amino-4-deoxy-L-arabinose transferase-like glycosyltransferase
MRPVASTPDPRAPGPAALRLPPAPVLAIAAITVLGLLILAPAYGFHRDELYFVVAGRHPDWGYVDQPPVTPLLSAAMVALLGPEPWALRVLPALAIGACVVLAAMIAADLGGSRRAQALAALVLAVSGYLGAGHLGSTTTYDLLAWAVILWLATRLLAGGNPRLWLVVGAAAGIGLQNKHLVLFLAGGLVIGLLLHRRDLLRTRWPWLGAALALLIWAPNAAWQVANGLPQLEMAQQIGADVEDQRAMVIVEILLLAGPLLFPVSVVGQWQLWRSPSLRPFRALGTAFAAILAVMLLTGGKSYYVVGALPPLIAAGAITVDRWLGESRVRLVAFGGITAGSLALIALLTLPVLPAATLADTPIPDIYAENAEQVGWPELVAAVEGVVGDMPPDLRERAVILTDNYGELGALELLGEGLPPAYSGHNSAWSWGPPPDDRDVVILVTPWDGSRATGRVGRCIRAATVRNASGMPNEEQGGSVAVCQGMPRPWSVVWPELRDYG